MDCDIHFHVEIKVDGFWEHYNHPRISRRYELFAKLADVRNSFGIEPVSQPKGLPADATLVTKLCDEYQNADHHSHSWLSAEEIAEVESWWKERYEFRDFIELEWGCLFGNTLGGLCEYPKDYPDWLQDVRVVFWFDN